MLWSSVRFYLHHFLYQILPCGRSEEILWKAFHLLQPLCQSHPNVFRIRYACFPNKMGGWYHSFKGILADDKHTLKNLYIARRVLRDINSESLVESVHLHPAARQDHVHAFRWRAGWRRAWQVAATDADALCESVRTPDPALRQHSRVQEIPYHGSRSWSR